MEQVQLRCLLPVTMGLFLMQLFMHIEQMPEMRLLALIA
jgi:hypothetical protein